MPDYDEIASIEDTFIGNITKGCESRNCNAYSCKNKGKCLKNWEDDDILCDCEMTSFSGSNGYLFDKSNSDFISFHDIIFTYHNEDHLVFGIETSDEDAILFRADYASSDKYIIAEISQGFIHVSYNFDNKEFVNTFKKFKINDDKYHVIKFSRVDANSTLEVDFYNQKKELWTNTSAQNSRYLNDASVLVHIGGHQVENSENDVSRQGQLEQQQLKQSIKRQFTGNIYGLVFNKIRILDLAAQKDDRIVFSGTPNEIKAHTNDDDQIVYPECSESSSKECTPNLQTTDEIVVPHKKHQSVSTKASHTNDATTQTNQESDESLSKMGVSIKTTTFAGAKPLTTTGIKTTTTIVTTEEKKSSIRPLLTQNMSLGVIITISVASALAFIMLVYALCKYHNRDEGTYTIDETKSFGPFAELNSSQENEKEGSFCVKKKAKKVKHELKGNKEWFV